MLKTAINVPANVQEAVDSYNVFNQAIEKDTTNFKNDSMLLIYEERIKKLQEKFNKEQPE